MSKMPPAGIAVPEIHEPPQLQRSLKRRHVEMIAIGGIIGAGLFVGSSASIATVGPAIIFSYLIAGMLVLLVMRMLSEMATAIPGVQSFPEFARLGLGSWAGFMSGWLYWYFWVVVVAIEAIAGAAIIHSWYPIAEVWQIGAVLMAILTGVNLLSARSYGEVEFWFSSVKVAAIIVFILLAFGYATGIGHAGGPTFGNLTEHGGFMPKGGFAILGGVTSVIFALVGAEIATIAAAESDEPERLVARITTTVAVRILIFYILSIALIVSIIPWTMIVPGTSPFAATLGYMGITGGETIMNAIVLVAVLSCLNSGIYVTSRVLFSLSAKGDAPGRFTRLGSQGVPRAAILFGAFFSYIALAVSIVSPAKGFAFLVNASGAIMIFIYLLIAFSQLRLRKRLEAQTPERLTVRMWWHPWGTYFAIAGMVAVLVAMGLTKELTSQFWASAVAVALAAIAYPLVRRSR